MTEFNLPPVFVDAEHLSPPSVELFRARPAQTIQVGDLVLLHEVIFRVKEHRNRANTPRHHFTLWPVLGVRPETAVFYSREWIPTYRPLPNRR